MLLPNPKDAIHKAWLYRILVVIADDNELVSCFRFKGGTCAAMLGYLDRFSIDLDFDLLTKKNKIPWIRKRLEYYFKDLGLVIRDKSRIGVQYFLKYPAPTTRERNTIKLDTLIPLPLHNQYEAKYLPEIDRTFLCQTIETMFANKLVALIDRYEKQKSIAGRDVYDIHHFFLEGYRYDFRIIEERRKSNVADFLSNLIAFIETHINQDLLDQDLNPLISYAEFRTIRKTLKRECILLLKDELRRLPTCTR